MGTTVTWVDRRRGIASVNDLYATRIDPYWSSRTFIRHVTPK